MILPSVLSQLPGVAQPDPGNPNSWALWLAGVCVLAVIGLASAMVFLYKGKSSSEGALIQAASLAKDDHIDTLGATTRDLQRRTTATETELKHVRVETEQTKKQLGELRERVASCDLDGCPLKLR